MVYKVNENSVLLCTFKNSASSFALYGVLIASDDGDEVLGVHVSGGVVFDAASIHVCPWSPWVRWLVEQLAFVWILKLLLRDRS